MSEINGPSWYTENSSTPPSFVSHKDHVTCYQNNNMDSGPPWHPVWNEQYCMKGGNEEKYKLKYKKYKNKYKKLSDKL